MPRATPRARRLRTVVAEATRGSVAGVEREYTVRRDGIVVDARTLVPAMPGLGVALDPSDSHARRGGWGGVVTADGRHAEVATPPVTLASGCTSRLLALAASGRAHLAANLPPGCTLQGYSTHLNVEVPDRLTVRVARLVATHLAASLMLALDRADSPGLLVRPRPGRLEIGGEFAAGDQLRAAAALAIGVTALAERALLPGPARHLVHRLPEATVVPSVQRYGWYVDRRAYGPDLYALGRQTALGSDTAGGHLRRVWERARPLVVGQLGEADLLPADRAVAGLAPLPMEDPVDDDGATVAAERSHDFGPRRVGDLEVTLERATWWKALLRITGAGRTRWVVVPGRALEAVLDAIDAGVLTEDLASLLERRVSSRAA